MKKPSEWFKSLRFNIVVGAIAGVIVGLATVYVVLFVIKVLTNLVFATGIMALGTLTLALFTYWNIRGRSVQEKRDREERWLKEIKDWATNVLIAGIGPGERDIFEIPEDEKLLKVSLLKQITEMRRLNREGIAFKYIDLSDWKDLVNKSKKLRRAIGVQVGLLDECSKFTTDEVKYEATLNVAEKNRSKMNGIAESIIKKAQNNRSNLLKSK